MEFRILGLLEAVDGGRASELRGAKPRRRPGSATAVPARAQLAAAPDLADRYRCTLVARRARELLSR